MDDTISRQAALDALVDAYREKREGSITTVRIMTLEGVMDVLSQLPSAQPQRMRGRWKRTYLDHEAMGERPSIFYCSACNQCIAYPTNYCPSCGAKMDGGDQE